MMFGGRIAALGAASLVGACAFASCANSPTAVQKKAVHDILTTTTAIVPPTTSTTAASTTTTAGVGVPNVIGMKIAVARSALRTATLPAISLNTPCNKGTLASQSVVSSLSIPGKAPTFNTGAVPLSPGTVIAPGTRVGITWSGCFGDSAQVPAVVGLTLAAARHALHAVGLNWACYSTGLETTTTSKPPPTTTSVPDTTTTKVPKAPQTVLTQDPAAHTALRPGATVSLTMHRCPQ